MIVANNFSQGHQGALNGDGEQLAEELGCGFVEIDKDKRNVAQVFEGLIDEINRGNQDETRSTCNIL